MFCVYASAAVNLCCLQRHLMSLVRRELQSWNETFSLESMPHDPLAFSYWVVSSLPLDDSMKITLLAINSAVQRLRAELHVMRAVSFFVCSLKISNKNTSALIILSYCNAPKKQHACYALIKMHYCFLSVCNCVSACTRSEAFLNGLPSVL